ncbi:MAG: hypothetical protein HOQ24_04325 [Mycobacteriaceae bacterium]|nr:hypothetical protein [Mycobacteriaceae bacterium]
MPAVVMRRTGSELHRPGAVINHTTLRVYGEQQAEISVRFARTQEAFVTLDWGKVLVCFKSADAAQGVLEGFAGARGHMMGVDYELPMPPSIERGQWVNSTVQLTWERRLNYTAERREVYSERQRRTLRWVDLQMGPVTWQLLDRVGYDSAIDILRETHRTAVAVCLDGAVHRADPTRDDYRYVEHPSPQPALSGKRKPSKPRAKPEGTGAATLIEQAIGADLGSSNATPLCPRVPDAADIGVANNAGLDL